MLTQLSEVTRSMYFPPLSWMVCLSIAALPPAFVIPNGLLITSLLGGTKLLV